MRIRHVIISRSFWMLAVCLWLTQATVATETENHGFHILPAPGTVAIDGKTADWNLAGGIFVCGDVEHLRDQFAVWLHGMADAEHLYLLARWKDPIPVNKPEHVGAHGLTGDCLQVRFILFPGTPDATTTWWDFSRDARGNTVVGRGWPGPRNGVLINPLQPLTQAEEQSVRQAFLQDADGKGYAQEIAIPWKLLAVSGTAPKPGEKFRCTVEPKFTAGAYGSISIKDLFDPAIKAPDRIFTFRAYQHWGWAALAPDGAAAPQAVRLADGRAFPVTMRDGQPVIDWFGLSEPFEWPGFKPITFEMPFDGYVSLNIIAPDGTVARHLLNWEQRARGHCTVQWDGLSDATYRTPGVPVPAGDYSWKAIAHPGAKLTFRGYASDGGRVPWQSGPQDCWLGDQGVPAAVVTDGERMYLACNGAEGGRHLLAADLQGKVIWGLQNTTGGADPEHIAVADGAVYVLHPKVGRVRQPGAISRVDAKTGAYLNWPGSRSHILRLDAIRAEGRGGADHFDGIAACNGKLYVTASDATLFNEDVADWKALFTHLKADTPLAKRVMAKVSPDMARFMGNLAGRETFPEQAFAIRYGGPRLDHALMDALNSLLPATDLAPDAAELAPPARTLANRRFIGQAFAPAFRPPPAHVLEVIDIATGKVAHTWPLPFGGALAAVSDTLVYVISADTDVLALDPTTGKYAPVVRGLRNARGITVDGAGHLYVSVGAPEMRVLIFSAQGEEIGAIGRTGGRPLLGPWQADGMCCPAGVAVDSAGKLWVMEHDPHPKRVSVWNLKDGQLTADFFGPTQYGASGSAINPRDPNLMIGAGCEWRLNPQTGKSACVGVFDRQSHNFATFREGNNGRQYLYTNALRDGAGAIQVWERLGDAQFAKRAELRTDGDFRNTAGRTVLWVDADGDGQEQPEELQSQHGALFCAGRNALSLNLGPDLTLYAFDWKDKTLQAIPADGFTACGAPKYDLAKLRPLPKAMSAGYENNLGCALPSADNSTILINHRVKDHPAGCLWKAFDLATGTLKWSYPNPYFEVGGSHLPPAPDPGLFRGAFGPVGAVTLPGVGDCWIINGYFGEWNVLTADGFYLTRLFKGRQRADMDHEGDGPADSFYLTRLFKGSVFEWLWPADAAPGGDMTDLPPGCGGEDFGGSVTQAADGKVYVQAGTSAIWNLLLTGLDRTVAIPGGELALTEADTKQAQELRAQALQAAKRAQP